MILIFLLLLIAPITPAGPKLFVVQSLDESAATIEIESGIVNARAVTLGNIPNDIIVSKNRIYVSNSGYNNIQEIDAETSTTIREIQVPGGVNVYSMALLNEDSLAVTCSVSGNVVVIRLSDEQVVAELPAGAAPQSIIVHDGYFYVADTGIHYPNYESASILVYDCRTLSRVDSIPVAINPQSMAVDEQNRLHVVCTGNYAEIAGEINVIELASRELLTEIPIGGSPMNISIGGGIAYLAAGGWGTEGYVYAYRVSDFGILYNASNPLETAPGVWDTEARDDGSFFVSCFNDDMVEHRNADGSLIRSYLVSDGPGQMTVFQGIEATNPHPNLTDDSFVLVSAYPNPFNSSVKLVFDDQPHEACNILIYNSIGQAITTLPVGAGASSVTWNAMNGNGYPLSTGVYYAVFDQNAAHSVNRLFYLK
jgi:hypothetical protein